MASDALCSVVKGYQKCSLKCRGQFINGVSVIRINCKNAQEKPVLMGLLWACFVYIYQSQSNAIHLIVFD